MPGTLSEEGVCRDQMIEPVLYSNNVGRVSHIRDPAPMDWSDQDRRKYHQVELQALLGGPIPADTQLVIRALGQRCFDGWLGVVIRQMFRPVPRPGFHSAVFKRKRLQGRTSYPTFLDMGVNSTESMELQALADDTHFSCLRGPVLWKSTEETWTGFVNAWAISIARRKDCCFIKGS
jgi:hypothetical protein